ncbi:MAG TPA: sulfatase-like hydrolase/transferase, partial [Micromonosporaceae bacterium]|nr:sulfatase-like hydrolase/transferase [Micromonosporaceae bacterium]
MTHAATSGRRRRPRRDPAEPPARRWELLALLELCALSGLAIAQPLLEATGRAPDFFLFHRAGRVDILLLTAIIVAAPPLLLWGAGLTTRLVGTRVRRVVHALTLGALTGALAVQAGKWLLPLRGLPLALVALLAGLLVVAAYLRWTVPARLLRVAAIGPLVSVLLFVFASPTGAVVLGGKLGGTDGSGPAPAVSTGAHPPIVVVVLDELPQASLLDDAGRLDAERFPAFARLAADSTWYRNATAVAGVTPYAVPSMLTGRYPPTSVTAPHYSAYPENLFSLLSGVYEMRVQESVVQLCAPRVCGADVAPKAGGEGLPALLTGSASLMTRLASPNDSREDPMAEWTEPVGTGAADGAADGAAADAEPLDVRFRWRRFYQNQPVRFNRFVDGLRPGPDPTLHFLHLLLPHQPFQYLPSGARYERPRKPLPGTGGWWASLARQRHLLQARYTDRLLGVALDAMRESGLYDSSLVVVTADHGLAFTPEKATQRRIDAAQDDAAAIGWVPLFVKAPGQREPRQ